MTSKGAVSGLLQTAIAGGVLLAALAVGAPAKAEAQNFSVGVEFGRPVATYGYAPAPYPYERWDWERREAARERYQAYEARRAYEWREQERREAWRDHERHEAWERERGYGSRDHDHDWR